MRSARDWYGVVDVPVHPFAAVVRGRKTRAYKHGVLVGLAEALAARAAKHGARRPVRLRPATWTRPPARGREALANRPPGRVRALIARRCRALLADPR